MNNVSGWNNSNPYRSVGAIDLEKFEDDFEAASSDGRQFSLDRLIDKLSKEVNFADDASGNRLQRLDKTLDRLGRDARLGRHDMSGEDNDLIQRLRSASLAGADGGDDLESALGDISPEQLLDAGQGLADRLRDSGQHRAARAIEKVLSKLEDQIAETKPSQGGDLADMTDAFEEAAADGDGESLDEIVDKLAGDVKSDGGRRDERLGDIEQGLDELGGMAREYGADSNSRDAKTYGADNETIQRLRSAMLAAKDGSDGLATALGDMSLDELIERAQDLSDKLSDGPYADEGANVDRAIEELEKLSAREEQYGRLENGDALQRHRSVEDAVDGWN